LFGNFNDKRERRNLSGRAKNLIIIFGISHQEISVEKIRNLKIIRFLKCLKMPKQLSNRQEILYFES
jgi:hypothetical protein